jgi:hypothetical protein
MKLRDAVAPLRTKRDSLSPPMKQKLAQLLDELQKREAVFAAQERELEGLFRSIHASANNHIFVHGRIYPDNLLQVGAQVKKIREGVPGPLKVALRDGKLVFLKLKVGENLNNPV